jgi:predicted membrane protein (TIGR00267 family)
MIKRVLVTLLIGLCAVSLSVHFAVESLGGVLDHFIDGQTQGMFPSHEEDHFVLREPGDGNSPQSQPGFPFRLRIHRISRPPTPLFQPPKSISSLTVLPYEVVTLPDNIYWPFFSRKEIEMDKLVGEKILISHLEDKRDAHRRASALSDIILGVAAATNDPRIVLVAGLAATFAESVSMGAVAYTSTMADADFYESEREREYRHIREMPHLEREEMRAIYTDKGFNGELLERIVDTITANRDVWVAALMAEEHQLTPIDRTKALRAAIVVGFSAVVGSLIPLVPFVILKVGTSIWVSILCTALVLYAVGAYKARITVGRQWKSGIEMAIIGTVSALVGYAIGLLWKVPTVP